MLLLSYARRDMLSASWWPSHLLYVDAVVCRRTWSMDKSWRYVTLFGFHHSHIVHCQWNHISCGAHLQWPWPVWFSSDHWCRWRWKPGSRIVGLPLSWNWPPLPTASRSATGLWHQCFWILPHTGSIAWYEQHLQLQKAVKNVFV